MLFGRNLFGYAFDSGSRSIRERERRILGQIDVDIREVRQILREELMLQSGSYREADGKYDEGKEQSKPPVLDCQPAHTIVGRAKSTRAPLLNRGFGAGPEQIVAEERNKRHGDESRSDQRAGDHDRQRVEKLSCITAQQHERHISHDVRDRGVHDRFRQLSGAEPGRDERRMVDGEIALDRVTGYHRIIHKQPERNNQGCDRDLLQVNSDRLHHAERHEQRDRNRERHQ